MHAATWMYLKDIMLSETSQTPKDEHCTIPLIWPQIVKFMETSGGCQGLGERGTGSYCFQSMELQFEMTDGDDGWTALWMHSMLLNYILKLIKVLNFMACIF